MKLFAKYNRINVVSTVAIFLLASVAFSFLLRYVIFNGIDEDLRIERNEVLTYVQKYSALPPVVEVHDQYTSYQKVKVLPEEKQRLYTHHVHDRYDDDEEMIRSIVFGVAVNQNNYLVTVSKSLEGTDDLIQSIIIITVTTIILILTATFFINRFVLRKLWQPFYQSLSTLSNFKLSDADSIAFSDTRIDEFNLLNTTLSGVINKAQQDYIVLKEFTENASHEMQTPLAVINSKLDVIIQSEALTELQSKAAEGAYDAIQKLKRLNQSLLLLAKIENRQFAHRTDIDLAKAIENKLLQFAEQWQKSGFVVSTQIAKKTLIDGNPQLIDILLNNLIGNAARHNTDKGFINITLQPQQLKISNTGMTNTLDEQAIFNRFYKGDTSSEGHGLGLSIVKQICEDLGYVCRYYFAKPDVHSFIINW